MSKRYFILGLCMLFIQAFAQIVYAQNARTVTGVVVDEFGDPIIGAAIKIVDSTVGTISDIDGKFSLPVPEGGRLAVSFVGYVSQTITNLNNPKIVLKEDVANLDEVVIVGYGTQKMKNITGAIETITPDEIKDLSVGNLGDALSGMMSGLHVNSGGGRPGSTPSLQIRQSNINTSITPNSTRGGDADPSPLYVIDDFISTEDAFNNLDVSEVESITVLKDASAAVYGARAAYGVILVKTKRGKVGTPSISYTGQFGFTDALKKPKMLSAYDYGRIYNAARVAGTSTGESESDNRRTQYFQADELEAMRGLNYDLLDDEWSAAWTQRHSFSINGGTEKATYFVKFNVDGLLRGDYQSRMNGYATARQNGWMSANDIRELENLDLNPPELGGDLYLINGNMTKLEDAGIFAATTAAGKEDENDEEVLEVEESDGDQSGDAGTDTGEDTVSKRHHRRGKLV